MRSLSIVPCALFFSCNSEYDLKGERPDVDPGEVTECPFEPIAGTKMSQYSCNPVYPEGEESVNTIGFYATEVLGHPFYQMWYSTDLGIQYAVSSEGTDWESYAGDPLLAPESNTWDQDALTNQVIVWDPIDEQYLMSYQGYNLGVPSDGTDDIWGIGMATSPDGISWTKHPNNPVINFSEYSIAEQDYWNYFCNDFVQDSSICDNYGISYYSPYEITSSIQPCWPLTIAISSRGTITEYIGAKDAIEVVQNGFDWAQLEQDLWDNLFTGGTVELQPSNTYASCHLYSADALALDNWILNPTPVLRSDLGSYDGGGVSSAAVVELNDVHYLFYVGFEEWVENPQYEGVIQARKLTLNLATSTDGGITWTKDPNNPLPVHLTNPGQISAIGAQVIGSRIHLWVTDYYEDRYAVGYFYFEPDLEDSHP